MITDQKSIMALYEKANCSGEVNLFNSPKREAFKIAALRCKECPVRTECYEHVKPEDGFTGTVAGRLWYDGIDVTKTPDALPPPVFKSWEVDPELAAEVKEAFIAEDADFSVYNESTLMAAIWRLRKDGFRASRISRVFKLTKERIQQLTDHFEEESPRDLKDFLLGFDDARLRLPVRTAVL